MRENTCCFCCDKKRNFSKREFVSVLEVKSLEELKERSGIETSIFYALKKGARFWLPPLSSALVYPCEQSIFFTNHFPDLRENKC